MFRLIYWSFFYDIYQSPYVDPDDIDPDTGEPYIHYESVSVLGCPYYSPYDCYNIKGWAPFFEAWENAPTGSLAANKQRDIVFGAGNESNKLEELDGILAEICAEVDLQKQAQYFDPIISPTTYIKLVNSIGVKSVIRKNADRLYSLLSGWSLVPKEAIGASPDEMLLNLGIEPTITITYNAEGAIPPQVVQEFDADTTSVSEAPRVIKPGYNLEGWYEGSVKVMGDMGTVSVNKSRTFTAKFVPAEKAQGGVIMVFD